MEIISFPAVKLFCLFTFTSMSRGLQVLTRMRGFYFYVSTLCVLLTVTTDVHCDEESGLSPSPNTESESQDTTIQESDAQLNLPEAEESTTPPESEESSTPPESDESSTSPERVESSTQSESEDLSSGPGWYVGSWVPDNSSEAEGKSENEMSEEGNGTSNEERSGAPLIIMRYPLEGSPEILVGSLMENGTFMYESENGNNTKEGEFDINDFNITDFPGFPVEEGFDEEIFFETDNGTEVWIDMFVIPDENVTEGIGENTGEAETTVLPLGNETETETNLTTENILGASEDSSLTGPPEVTATAIPEPSPKDTDITLPV